MMSRTNSLPDYSEVEPNPDVLRTVQEANGAKSQAEAEAIIPVREPGGYRFSDVVVGVMSGVAADGIWGNASIQSAIQVLEQLSELGSTLPLIAPVFILFKVIVDLETRARDVDAKCKDLLERITFMLGHLLVLRKVEVMDITRQVIDRIEVVLKQSAALIEAYRRQGSLAKRLNMTNKEKFASCASAVNTCCNDLMLSLQIQQSGQLDILTRSIPIDAEDEAAQTFITSHGGEKAIKGDKQLLSQFADQLHLKLDSESMDQINSNLVEVMQQNQIELERVLNSNVSGAVVEGIKALSAQMHEAELEQRLRCVQCSSEYRNSVNGPTSCQFHKATYDSWQKRHNCCADAHPCQYNYHRNTHHNDYPYGPFFERASAVSNYVDTVDEWAKVEDTSLEENDTQKAYVGRLLRWVSRGPLLEEQTILISVGTIWHTERYFFDTFTPSRLESVARAVSITRNPLIFRTSQSQSVFTMAEWVISPQGDIKGVRITAKSATSGSPSVKECPIDISTCEKSGDVAILSEGGLWSYKPAGTYEIPETVRFGGELTDKKLREPRTDFKTRNSAGISLMLKPTSEPPLLANPHFANYDFDTFVGTISIFSKQQITSIGSIEASYRLIGDEAYSPVKSCGITNGLELPLTIASRQTVSLAFEVKIPRTEEDIKLQVNWWNRAFLARKRPLRLKLTLIDIEDEESSVVLEYVFPPYPLEKAKESDLGFFYFDDLSLFTRRSVRVEGTYNQVNYTTARMDKPSTGVITIGGRELDVLRLNKVVYQAIQSGKTEVDLEIGQVRDDWVWAAYALVDTSVKRVYAFKILLKQTTAVKHTMGCMGYVLCPIYGDVINEARPIKYATETVNLPEMSVIAAEEFVADDTIDDLVEAPKHVPQASTAGMHPSITSSGPLEGRLASIDSNLSRLATAVERLVDLLEKRQ